MNRRDTILIAVLLNAGLLIVLFATSLKSDKKEEVPVAMTVLASHHPESVEQNVPATKPTLEPTTGAPIPSQLDSMIEKYVTPQISSTPNTAPNFLADLQPLGNPNPSVSGTDVSTTSDIQKSTSIERENGFKEVKVQKGDVLERIARQHHVTVSELMKVNKLSSTRLKIGQVLKVPVHSGVGKVASSNLNSQEGEYYTIKAGDNPWTIAVKHHMKVEDLLKLNNMDEQKAKRLKAGDQIRIK
jgi:LysM repeat protein